MIPQLQRHTKITQNGTKEIYLVHSTSQPVGYEVHKYKAHDTKDVAESATGIANGILCDCADGD